MQKKIGRKVYDTDKAEYVGRNAEGYYGDPTGFEEILYKKATEDFFLFVSGGPESQYPEEDLIPIAFDNAKEWIERVCGKEVLDRFTAAPAAKKATAARKKPAPKAKAPAAAPVKADSKTTEKTVAEKKTTAKPAATKTAAKTKAAKAKTETKN